MRQNIFGGYHNTLQIVTSYDYVNGSNNDTTVSGWRKQVISTPGFFSKLRFEVSAAPGAGDSRTAILMVNGVDTLLSVALGPTDTEGTDKTHRVHVNAGDYVTMHFAVTGTPSVSVPKWTVVFEGDRPNESVILGGDDDPLENDVTRYNCLMGVSDWVNGTGIIYAYTECPANE